MLQIIGKGGMAREVAAYFYQQHKNEWISIKCNFAEFDEIEDLYPETRTVIAIGDPKIRKKIALSHNFNYHVLDFSKSYVSLTETTKLHKGTIVCPGTIITTNVRIGEHVIINLNCTIHHDVKIKNFTTISPGVNICGNVEIGECCFIGANSVIKEKVKICDDVIIGAGSVVINDITEPGTYVGNPVKKIK